jgi:hypothetical protein
LFDWKHRINYSLGSRRTFPLRRADRAGPRSCLYSQIPLRRTFLNCAGPRNLGSGYLLRAVVKLGAKPVSLVEGALVTVGANSVGTLGGGEFGTAGVTYFWLRKRGVNPASAGLGGWIPIFLSDAVLAIVSLVGLLTLILLESFRVCSFWVCYCRSDPRQHHRNTPLELESSRKTHGMLVPGVGLGLLGPTESTQLTDFRLSQIC